MYKYYSEKPRVSFERRIKCIKNVIIGCNLQLASLSTINIYEAINNREEVFAVSGHFFFIKKHELVRRFSYHSFKRKNIIFLTNLTNKVIWPIN